MKKSLGKILVVLCFLSITQSLWASHIVGGYLSYECLGTVGPTEAEYRVTMRFYRDCANGNPGTEPDSIPITVFDQNNIQTDVFWLNNLILLDTIPDDVSNPCVVSSPSICVQQFIFDATVRLNRFTSHTLVFQRCCKNDFLDNLPPPSDNFGNTFIAEIPRFATFNCNSSPEFNNFPPIVLCAGFDVNLDMSASDVDGDSLVYSLCAPFDYPQGSGPVRPVPASAPPYGQVPFRAPQTATDPIPSNPQLSINPSTGRLTGVPTSIGNYLVGFCVEEYRNGVLVSTLRREIQINTANCNPLISTAVQDQTQFCDGLSVQFQNNSSSIPAGRIRDYKWDFGVPGVDNDTSRVREPVFTFPDTGLYTITLISNPDFPACSDTSTKDFQVNQVLDPMVDLGGTLCQTGNSIDFFASGTYEDYATFLWSFGSQASITSSTSDTVRGVVFSAGAGTSFPVSLSISQDNCTETINQQVTLLPNPTVDFTLSDSAGCYPLPVSFTSTVTNATSPMAVEYEWDFGDGETSTDENPTHTYDSNGYFDVRLTIRTTSGCIDTVSLVKDSAVFVSLDSSRNSVDFTYNPSAGCAPLDVQFTNQSVFEGNASFTWTFGDGDSAFTQNPSHIYTNNGYYDVSLTMITLDKCVDTINFAVDSAIKVSLDSSRNVVDFDFFPKEGCLPLTVQFSDSSTFEGNADFFWDFGDGTLSTDQNPTKVYTDSGAYSVGLLLITKDKCVDTLVKTLGDTLRILPRPTAVITASDSAKPLKQANFRFTNTGSEFVQSSRYLVNGVEVATSDILDYQFVDTGHYVIDYIAINDLGCEDTSSVRILVFDEFEFIIPNVFTPNNDGVNEVFQMRACGVYEYEIQIYNRFGDKVFESNSMNINWDGRISGRKASSGSYYYTIRIRDFRGEYLNYNGAVTVLAE